MSEDCPHTSHRILASTQGWGWAMIFQPDEQEACSWWPTPLKCGLGYGWSRVGPGIVFTPHGERGEHSKVEHSLLGLGSVWQSFPSAFCKGSDHRFCRVLYRCCNFCASVATLQLYRGSSRGQQVNERTSLYSNNTLFMDYQNLTLNHFFELRNFLYFFPLELFNQFYEENTTG